MCLAVSGFDDNSKTIALVDNNNCEEEDNDMHCSSIHCNSSINLLITVTLPSI